MIPEVGPKFAAMQNVVEFDRYEDEYTISFVFM